MGTNEKNIELELEILGFGANLKAGFDEARKPISDNFEDRLGVLYSAQGALFACLGSIYSRPDREFPAHKVTEKVHRASIYSAIAQGIGLIEIALKNGNYVQAAALIRQEIEAVEASRGLIQGTQREGTTPRLKALKHLGKSYGFLTSLAHLSRSNLMAGATNILNSGVDPTLNSELEKHLFCIHLVAVACTVIGLSDLHPCSDEMPMTDQERLWLQSVFGVLNEFGYLYAEPPEET